MTNKQKKSSELLSEIQYKDVLDLSSWTIYEAVLYSFGYKNRNIENPNCEDEDLNYLFIMDNEILCDLYNACSTASYQKKLPSVTKYFSGNYEEDYEVYAPADYLSFLETLNAIFPIQKFIKEHDIKFTNATPNYLSSYMQLMNKAVEYFSITDGNQPLKKILISWFLEQDETLSKREVESLATFVRHKNLKKGGRPQKRMS